MAVHKYRNDKKRRMGGVLFLPRDMCVKYGYNVQLAEAAALRYVAKMTKVPVPKVYCASRHKRITYILMQRINGEERGKNWAQRSPEERESLLRQLKGYFDELRSIPHPSPGAIAASDMQSLWDPGLLTGDVGFGPFANESDSNNFLRFGLQKDYHILSRSTWIEEEERLELIKMVELQDSLNHKICFAHGDANGGNILVKGDKVVGLIDFEYAGLFPEYWEYTNALNHGPKYAFWKEEVGRFLRLYPKELELEKIRKEHFGPYGFRGRYMWY
ncbi:hypothetical protein LSUE1_G003759 [Lachnellula suecica]|uniref:Aminoglycoside phosphotransferase domain-containing protein n=1 Tax=Lachnellula suecica TaxID=602035 RepID=A0A8T9CNX3_9HELO|nr:hypothetical protein LSUE1_G003759 [Lachnellula suecica]